MTNEKLKERMALLEAEPKRGLRAETPALDEYIFAQDQQAKGDYKVMEERRESAEMTYEEKIEQLKTILGDEITVDLDLLQARVIDVLYKDHILKPQCEINLKKAEEQLGMEIHLDKDQTAKADAGKLPVNLVPTQIVRDIAEVRQYGNEKYGDPDNWRKVKKLRYVAALERHLLAYKDYLNGDDDGLDKESEIEHHKHMACNMAFICEMERWEKEDQNEQTR
jgi:hypothetical protein